MSGRIRKPTKKGAAYKASMQRPMKIARASSADGSLVTGHEGASLVPPSASGSPGPAGGSPVTGHEGESLIPPSSAPSNAGSPKPAGGGAAEEVCNDELEKLRATLKVVQGSAFDLVDELNRVKHEFDAAKTELASVREETLARLQVCHDDCVELRLLNNELQGSNDELQGSVDDNKSTILRLRAEIARLEATILRLEEEVASLRDQTSSTRSGKGPMAPRDADPRHAKGAGRFLGEGRGGASSASNGEGASSSHHRVSKTPPPPCEVCGDVHEPNICPFGINVETDIEIMKKIVDKRMREGKSLPVSFKDPRNSNAIKILGPLNNKGRNNKAHVYKILRRRDGTLRMTKKDWFLYIHHGLEPEVDVKPLNSQYFCLECGAPWTQHNGVYLRTLLKFWKKHFSAAYVAESNEHPGEPNKEADMDLDDELDGNPNEESRGYSSDDSEQ